MDATVTVHGSPSSIGSMLPASVSRSPETESTETTPSPSGWPRSVGVQVSPSTGPCRHEFRLGHVATDWTASIAFGILVQDLHHDSSRSPASSRIVHGLLLGGRETVGEERGHLRREQLGDLRRQLVGERLRRVR